MSILQKLLEQGRASLAAKSDAEAAKLAAEIAATDKLFHQARAVAVEAFGELANEIDVLPKSMPDGWCQHRSEEFHIRPLGSTGGKVIVAVSGNLFADGRRGRWEWKVVNFNESGLFRVETKWSFDAEIDKEPVGIFHERVNDLAEAIAICERHSNDYLEAFPESEKV